ncbi:craniofacial development protein 2-like [Sitophilus oryzae]|uniref:Craniofacial development protein 2-like n=1 Tax=Sitophilus oryzae TaxID=7048 RepID=A0A6J2YJ42_SITOR|nr:craniofacial development protein 2-like [Sitophilus oryzae]
MKIGIWNTQSIRGKLEEVVKELKKLNIDIASLSETKKKGQGIEQVGDYIHVYSGVPKEKRACKGISLLIHSKYKKFITNWTPVNERILTANLNLLGYKLTIIGTYGPNEDEEVALKDQYMELLNQTIIDIGSTREIVLIGDLNARVGRRLNHHIVGRHGEETENENGRRLINLCEQRELKIMNGYFAHRDIHKFTWRQETRHLKSIIDYLIVKQKTNLKINDVRACRGPECGSDHYLVKGEIRMLYETERKYK